MLPNRRAPALDRPILASPVHRVVLIAALLAIVLPVPGVAYELGINCGGDEYVSLEEGRTFEADRTYASNPAGYIGGTPVSVEHLAFRMGDTADEQLYYRYRRDLQGYAFDVPAGDYLVRLYLGEMEVHGPVLHHQSIALEGEAVATDLDLFALVDREYAVVLGHAVTVTDGTLNIDLSSPEFTHLNALAVESITPDTTPPGAPASITGYGSYRRNLIDWPKSPEPDVRGYRVYRAAAAGGPYAVVGVDPLPVSRYHDDDVTPGIQAYYRVSAVDVFGNEGAQSDEIGLTPLDPSTSTLPVYDLTLGPAELLTLQLDPVSDEYVAGGVAHGAEVRPDVKVRFRGNNTRERSKKPYKVKFPFDEPWNDRRKLNFDSMFLEKLLLRDGLGYMLFDEFNVMTPLNEIVHLELNDEYLGLYQLVEQVDAYFLARQGLNPANNIYKCFDNLALLPTLEDYRAAYTKETHEGSSYQDLIELIQLINLTSQPDFPRRISQALDVDEYLRYYAVIIAEANVDFTRSNYFLMNDRDRDIWRIIPWDNGFTFGITSTPEWPLDLGSFQNPGWQSSKLIGRLMDTPEFCYVHAQNLLRLADGPFAPARVDAHVDSVHAAIEFDALRDWFKWGWEDQSAFQDGPARLNTFCNDRRDYILTAAYDLMPEVPGLLVINEVMASNATTILDEHGDADPWIEIWNSAYAEIGIGGMFLSDDPDDPRQWVLPDVRVPAHGHVVVWLDGEPHEGPLHAGFTLDATNGGDLYLRDVLGNGNGLLDSVAYGPATADVAEGRVPDGGDLAVIHVPTPGASNVGGFDPPPQVSDVTPAPLMPAHQEPVTVTARIVDESAVGAARVYYDLGAGFVSESMFDDGAHGDGAAGDSVYGGFIPGADYQTHIAFYVWAEDDSAFAVTDPAAAPEMAHAIEVIGGDPDLLINEFMAQNTDTVTDEFGEFDDWMEIFNNGDYAVNLSGMSLADDVTVPGRWELPDHLLGSGEHVLVWVDDDEEQGPLHANFQLNAAGEQLAIFDIVEKGFTTLDAYTFGPQIPDLSMGRYPDGAPVWVFLEQPTPGYTNTPSGIEGGGGTAGAVPRVLSLAHPVPNPFNPHTAIRFALPERGLVRLSIYDIQGRLVRRLAEDVVDAGEYERTWDGVTTRGARAASGVYWVRLETAAGTRVRRAVLVR